jgi:putative flippase GtrA
MGIVLRSMGVGAIATAVDFGLLALLVSGLGVDPRLASAPALALGVVAQFVGNKLVAFRDHSRAWLRQGALFFAVEALGFAANLVLYDLAMRATSGPYLLVRLVTTNVVYFGLCLPLWARIFRPSHGEAAHGPPELGRSKEVAA